MEDPDDFEEESPEDWDLDNWEDDYCEHIFKTEQVGTTDDGWPIIKATCELCGYEEEDVLIEERVNFEIELLGKKYRPYVAWGNISRCMECSKIIFGNSLILWPESGEWGLTFCFKCGKDTGIINALISKDPSIDKKSFGIQYSPKR